MSLDVDIVVHRGSREVRAAFSVGGGAVSAVVGPNGAGKSTVLAAVAGHLPPTAGRVVLDGTVLYESRAGTHVSPRARGVALVHQDLLLFPHLSCVDNVAFPLRARGAPRGAARERAAEMLEAVEVANRGPAPPSELSGGEAQRVALARALVARPRALLLDEPLSALDVRARSRMRTLLRRVFAEFSGPTLVVTHDPVDALSLADRIVVMEDGAVVQQGPVDTVRRAPRSGFVADVVGLNLFAGALEPLEGGTGRVVTPDGAVVVAWPATLDPQAAATREVLATVRPSNVTVHLARPEGSARNVLCGPVASIARGLENSLVSVASSPPVRAEVTADSLDRLGLEEGGVVWVAFKASAVEVVPA